jgi:hypothetical protein
MRALVVMATGCWTSTPARVVNPPPVATGPCEIRDHGEVIAGSNFELSLDGAMFASPGGPFKHIEATFDDSTARAKLENSQFVLEGQLDLSKLSLRPRATELYDGWIELRTATPLHAEGASLRVQLELPAHVVPATKQYAIACSALTFEHPPDAAAKGDERALAFGTPLYAGVGERQVAQLRKGDDDIVMVIVLERRGAFTRVRLDGDNPIVVWVASNRLSEVAADGSEYGIGTGGFGRKAIIQTCERDVPIYVRGIRVGHVKKGAAFRLKDGASGDELEIVLGQADGVIPYLKSSELSACSVQP